MIKKSLLIVFCLLSIAICSFVFAADSEVTLDTTDTSSGFAVKDSDGNSVFRAGGDGNVGIGTTSPSSALDVNGDILSDTVGYDAEGAFRYCKINGAKTKVYTEYFTGIMDSDNLTLVPHGIADFQKILNISIAVYSSSTNNALCNNYYYTFDSLNVDSNIAGYASAFDSTYIRIANVELCHHGQNYRVKMEYTE
jgi:hypothetical protein